MHKFSNNINTDDIIAAKYLNSIDAKELGKHCMESIDVDFASRVKRGDIIVAGKNFGCGSSREHAPLAIKGIGISCVIAESFARIFFRNAINIGLPILELKEANNFKVKDKLEINLIKGEIKNLAKNKVYKSSTFPDFMQEIVGSGGLLRWIQKRK